jgi:hypothetical protein
MRVDAVDDLVEVPGESVHDLHCGDAHAAR